MKSNKNFLIFIFIVFLSIPAIQAQYGYGNRGYDRNGYARQGSITRDAQPSSPKKEEPLTAKKIVDLQMPTITEILELNEFEQAIIATTLAKYMQQRIEIQLLKLTLEKTKEGYEKIHKKQTEELKSSLSEDKFNAFIELQENGFRKTKKKKKKKNRKKNK